MKSHRTTSACMQISVKSKLPAVVKRMSDHNTTTVWEQRETHSQ